MLGSNVITETIRAIQNTECIASAAAALNLSVPGLEYRIRNSPTIKAVIEEKYPKRKAAATEVAPPEKKEEKKGTTFPACAYSKENPGCDHVGRCKELRDGVVPDECPGAAKKTGPSSINETSASEAKLPAELSKPANIISEESTQPPPPDPAGRDARYQDHHRPVESPHAQRGPGSQGKDGTEGFGTPDPLPALLGAERGVGEGCAIASLTPIQGENYGQA
jgi:hypothetical protein